MDYKLTVRNCDTQNPQHSSAYECLKPGAGFAHLLDRPNCRPGEDLFFAEAEGAIIGYINVLQELSIGR